MRIILNHINVLVVAKLTILSQEVFEVSYFASEELPKKLRGSITKESNLIWPKRYSTPQNVTQCMNWESLAGGAIVIWVLAEH